VGSKSYRKDKEEKRKVYFKEMVILLK